MRYQYARHLVLLMFLALGVGFFGVGGALVACSGSTKAATLGALMDVTSCASGDAKSVADQISPLAEQAVELATGADGHVDVSKLGDAGKALKSRLLQCAFATGVKLALERFTKPGAPQSEAHYANPDELRAAFEVVRRDQFGGTTFDTPAGKL